MKRGTIDPPMAEKSKTKKVDIVFICERLSQILTVKRAIDAARAAAQMLAKSRGIARLAIDTLKNTVPSTKKRLTHT